MLKAEEMCVGVVRDVPKLHEIQGDDSDTAFPF